MVRQRHRQTQSSGQTSLVVDVENMEPRIPRARTCAFHLSNGKSIIRSLIRLSDGRRQRRFCRAHERDHFFGDIHHRPCGLMRCRVVDIRRTSYGSSHLALSTWAGGDGFVHEERQAASVMIIAGILRGDPCRSPSGRGSSRLTITLSGVTLPRQRVYGGYPSCCLSGRSVCPVCQMSEHHEDKNSASLGRHGLKETCLAACGSSVLTLAILRPPSVCLQGYGGRSRLSVGGGEFGGWSLGHRLRLSPLSPSARWDDGAGRAEAEICHVYSKHHYSSPLTHCNCAHPETSAAQLR